MLVPNLSHSTTSVHLSEECRTMNYVPNTDAEQLEMLRAVGAETIEDLLAPIPEQVRLKRPLDLPAALPEPDLKRLLLLMSEKNGDLDHYSSFLRAGSYDHILPS